MIITRPKYFIKKYKKLDGTQRRDTRSRIVKIMDDPFIGKPMSSNRKGTRETYVGAYRLSYVYDIHKDEVIFLDIYHKNKQ